MHAPDLLLEGGDLVLELADGPRAGLAQRLIGAATEGVLGPELLEVLAHLLGHAVDDRIFGVVPETVVPDLPDIITELLGRGIVAWVGPQALLHSTQIHRLLDDIVVVVELECHRVDWLEEGCR